MAIPLQPTAAVSIMRLGLRMLRSLLFVYVCLCLYAYFGSDRSIFLPPEASYRDSEAIVKVPIGDGRDISAIYLPNAEARYTILYSHGNAEDLGQILPVLIELQGFGFAVFAYDYLGYGTSDGKPSERNTYLSINAAYRYLTQTLEVPPSQIILYGRSLGGGPSIDLASREAIAGLIVEGTFITTFRVVTRLRIVPFDKFDNLSKIPNVYCPVLVIHGTDDEVVPFWHSETLFEAANEPKQNYWVENSGHNNLQEVAGDEYEVALQSFLKLVKKAQE
ncbi:phospholipase/carboxylesterase [Geitlerinema sp. FC II]|nr:alpha/beta hydrolase [Geitlerinema sp. CS-897]PPT08638.1 phospholipase/carboxylesterase [Geitlerinema sp. FC II]